MALSNNQPEDIAMLTMKSLNQPKASTQDITITEEEFTNVLLDNTRVVVEKPFYHPACHITALYVLNDEKTEILETYVREVSQSGVEFYKVAA